MAKGLGTCAPPSVLLISVSMLADAEYRPSTEQVFKPRSQICKINYTFLRERFIHFMRESKPGSASLNLQPPIPRDS